MSLIQLAPYFTDEAKAIEFIESLIWPDGAVCPHCGGSERVYRIKPNPEKRVRAGLWKCGHCRKQFTVKVGTIFEDSKLPMTKWLMAIYMMCSSKKGVSANQLSRELEISYKAAWFMCHRVRLAMTKEPLASKLGGGGGVVEVDETYIGGVRRNNRRKPYKGTGAVDKATVMVLIERGGEARTFPIPKAQQGIMQSVIRINVDESANLMTDGHGGYRGLDKKYASHQWVDHNRQMVRGIVHTNFAESYNSLLKRSILGTHHHISRKHLARYLREREFHWNLRAVTDGERTAKAIQGAKGKRLIYRDPA